MVQLVTRGARAAGAGGAAAVRTRVVGVIPSSLQYVRTSLNFSTSFPHEFA